MTYAKRGQPPKTLTAAEQAALLRVTGERSQGYRDHMLIAMGLGLALRAHEVSALNVGDAYNTTDKPGKVIRRIELRVFKRSNDDEQAQCVHVPDALGHKLAKFWRWKQTRGESLASDAPLFVARTGSRSTRPGGRMSTRSVSRAFNFWLQRLGYKPDTRGRYPFSFHTLRHTCATNLLRKTGNVRLVQRHLRHASINSTMRYATPSDDDVAQAVRDLDS